jgi:4,5:9,10-diseco-3-hydroxy-5,9,17-trioxoandrosta-1(10),2-diene-4-oate hydrolase
MFEDKYITIEGIKTRYWQAGEQGSLVVLIHGITRSVEDWQTNMADLATRHRVFALDVLGFGFTDKPTNEEYTISRLARFVLDFMTVLNIPKAHLIGNSLGGTLALECASQAPERVLSLVLADPAGMDKKGNLFEFRLATVPILGEFLTKPSLSGTKMIGSKAFFDSSKLTEEAIVFSTELARLPGAHSAFLKTLRSFSNFSGFKSEFVEALHKKLPHITAPTLVIWGKHDKFVTVAHAEVLRRLLPNVVVEIWEDCGHVPQFEYPKRFNDTTLKFLDSVKTQQT